MAEKQKPKGPWINRFAIHLFTIVLAVLLLWLFDFLVQDIKSIRGPDQTDIERRHVDQSLGDRKDTLGEQIANLERQITSRREEQRFVGDSSKNLQRTINQLLDLQKLSIQKDIALGESEQSALSTSLDHFLASQKQYQELNNRISDLAGQKRERADEVREIERRIAEQKKPASEEYRALEKKHRLKLAFLQLLVLVPLLVLGALLVVTKRSSIYFPLYLALAAAALLKVTLVMHEYFPSPYFKHVLVGVMILVVAGLLIHLIRTVAFPKAQRLIKQYREAYERFLCPVCEYPIRIGPRRFLYWTRRTVNRIILQQEQPGKEEVYTCPACGTALFEKCASCQAVRHSLLPHCRHCGAEKEMG